MRRYRFVCIMMLIMITLGGCYKSNSDSDLSASEKIYKQLPLNYDFGSTDYDIEYDGQNYFCILRNFAAAPEGYYFIYTKSDYTKWLSYFDKDTGKCVLVCPNPDCTHDTVNCNSYIGEDVESICYYEGHLYFELTDWNIEYNTLTISLYRISLDGSVREKVYDMYTVKSNETISIRMPQFIIHRGYVYYNITQGDSTQLYRKEINTDSNAELLYSNNGSSSSIRYLYGYGDGIFFVSAFLNKDVYEAEILYYDQISGEIFKAVENTDGIFTVFGDYIIYNYNNNIFKFNIKNLSSEILADDCNGYISSDGKYIYIDNIYNIHQSAGDDFSNRSINIYNISGDLVDVIDLSGIRYESDFGDGEYLFQTFNLEGIYAFDKSQIGTGKYEWIEVNPGIE